RAPSKRLGKSWVAVRPCFRALQRERAFPAAVCGPPPPPSLGSLAKETLRFAIAVGPKKVLSVQAGPRTVYTLRNLHTRSWKWIFWDPLWHRRRTDEKVKSRFLGPSLARRRTDEKVKSGFLKPSLARRRTDEKVKSGFLKPSLARRRTDEKV